MTSVKEFKKRVIEKLLNTNNEIKEEDLYFDQADSGYSLFMTHTETKEAFDVIKNLLPDKKEEE